MSTMIIENITPELEARLKAQAARNGISPDQQVLEILKRALVALPPIRLPKPIQPLRPITDEEIIASTHEGQE